MKMHSFSTTQLFVASVCAACAVMIYILARIYSYERMGFYYGAILTIFGLVALLPPILKSYVTAAVSFSGLFLYAFLIQCFDVLRILLQLIRILAQDEPVVEYGQSMTIQTWVIWFAILFIFKMITTDVPQYHLIKRV